MLKFSNPPLSAQQPVIVVLTLLCIRCLHQLRSKSSTSAVQQEQPETCVTLDPLNHSPAVYSHKWFYTTHSPIQAQVFAGRSQLHTWNALVSNYVIISPSSITREHLFVSFFWLNINHAYTFDLKSWVIKIWYSGESYVLKKCNLEPSQPVH